MYAEVAEKTTAPDAAYSASGSIQAQEPFSFALSLRFVNNFSPAAGEQATTGGAITKAVMVEGEPVLFRVRQSSGESGAVDYTVYANVPVSAELQRAAEDRISSYLSLGDDLGPFYAAAESDPPVRDLVRQLYGFHQVKFITPFENACWAVLAQRLAIPIARQLKQRLINGYGGSVALEGREYTCFPGVDQLSNVTAEELEKVLGNKQKAGYLASVIQAFSRVDEDWLRTGDYEQVKEWLLAIRGIGEWSAHFVLVRGLGRMEHAGTDERHLLAAASELYGKNMTPVDLAQIAERYGPAQGYWALYLRTPRDER